MVPYTNLPYTEKHKDTEPSPPKQAHVQDLKTTNQPVPRNSHSFRCAGTERNVPNQTAQGNKQTAAARCVRFPGITLPNKENNDPSLLVNQFKSERITLSFKVVLLFNNGKNNRNDPRP